MFKRPPTDTHFILLTLALVLVMAVPTFNTLVSNEEISEEDVLMVSTTLASRTPASVPAVAPMKVESALSNLTAFDLSCPKPGLEAISVTGSFVQFQGKNCLKNYKDGDVEIVNKSNGYTASVFSRGINKYQTDLIQLQKGENEIAIRYREGSGKAVEQIIRVRSSQI
ncbi:hypothetical protein [Bdellovibrio reynosensis]|uniref:Uncharacterized protein n=1 Tax=Bdellovibrio reynosensis TaxID=2835041 RepID=A0ABY4C4V4_9BACT|nr:hypothetical protein [Bdellovibrio reynosensis]UOE99976.1 hypothetical protein MNR06_09720 [Bdellovibrio reynosensis]